jgi:hypothetical protein
MDELALRIALLAMLLAMAVLLLFLQYVYGPHHRSASCPKTNDVGIDSNASNTGQSGHQSSQQGAEGDASQTPIEGEQKHE